MDALKRLSGHDATCLLDDYVERTFLFEDHRHLRIEHLRPWVGIFHHPPELPEWYTTERLQNLVDEPRWRNSLEHLRLVIALAPHSAEWIALEWQKPTVVVPHPAEPSPVKWSVTHFLEKRPVTLLQVGTFARDLDALEPIRVPTWIAKCRLCQEGAWVERAERACRQHFGVRVSGGVRKIRRVSDFEYDTLLSRSVVFVNLLAAAANNTILECVRRLVPVVVNRLPGPLYYLGADYPLFYERLDEVNDVLTEANVLAAHEHLKVRNQVCLDAEEFAAMIRSAVVEYAR